MPKVHEQQSSSAGNVGHNIEMGRANWSFQGDVAETFVDHVRQSVPGYDEGHDIVCKLSDFFCLEDSIAYELGTSTGQLLRKLAEHNRHKPKIRWIGVDAVQPMIQKAKEHCAGAPNAELVCDDIRLVDYKNSDFIVAYYVIQFIPPRDRQELINKIYQALNWGGGFVWFEKVRGPDARFQDMLTNLYNNFKLGQGFSAEEVLAKTESLKAVMEPFSSQGNIDLLKRAGFVDIMPIYRNLCFEGLVAIK
jgi:tRNA (cmo5U34)-methyltransferase